VNLYHRAILGWEAILGYSNSIPPDDCLCWAVLAACFLLQFATLLFDAVTYCKYHAYAKGRGSLPGDDNGEDCLGHV